MIDVAQVWRDGRLLEPFVYELRVDGEAVGHFRYDDGWRGLLDGPGSTVDRETLLSPSDVERLERELGCEGALVRTLDDAREHGYAKQKPDYYPSDDGRESSLLVETLILAWTRVNIETGRVEELRISEPWENARIPDGATVIDMQDDVDEHGQFAGIYTTALEAAREGERGGAEITYEP